MNTIIAFLQKEQIIFISLFMMKTLKIPTEVVGKVKFNDKRKEL